MKTTQVNYNPCVLELVAAADLPHIFRAVTLSEAGITYSQLGDIPFGILINRGFAGSSVLIQIAGCGLMEVGEDIKTGDLLTAEDGKAVRVIADDFIFARALSNSTSRFVQVQIIRAGFASIPFDEDESYNTVKIFFGFPISKHRRYRGIAISNPRDDLTREEIKETAQYFIDEQLILNSLGEVATYVLGAALKRKEITRIL